MMKKVLICVCLCCALIVGMACPVFAFTDIEDIDGQYSFTYEFRFSDFHTVEGYNAYCIPFDVSAVATFVEADEVNFSIDKQSWTGSFKEIVSPRDGLTYHFLGDVCYLDPSRPPRLDPPFCVAICQDDPAQSKLYMTTEFFNSLYVTDTGPSKVKIHVAVSDPIIPPDNATVSITDGVTGVIGFAGKVVSALVFPDGALFGLLPVVGMAVGLAIVVWGIRKFKSCTWGF